MNVKLRLKEFISNKSRSFEYQPLRKEIKPDYENQNATFGNPKTFSWVNITAKTAGTETKGGILSCCCQRRNERTKNILLNVSGIAKPHSLLAILGASGSGKTTLLNCLTNRNLGSLKAEGCILVNGENIGEDLYEISGYIQQEDTFIGNLTVKEHMWFYAMLNLPRNLSKQERQEQIEVIMKEMSLKKCENTAIGISGSKKGISGGERKRLSFAEKLLTKPSIIFCDEPTSGLDSFTARTVIQSLKLLADKGHTILTTLHQPSSDLFAMFDQIMFMAEGRVAFLGPKNDATKFLSGLGYQCPVNYNISDFFINTLAIIPGQEKEGKETIKKICNSFDESSYAKTIKYQIQEQMNVGNNIKIIEIQQLSKIISNGHKYNASWWIQLQMCTWRSYVELPRNQMFWGKFISLSAMALFIGFLFWQQTYSQSGIDNINAALSMLTIQPVFQLSSASTLRMSAMTPSLVKECYDRQYTIAAFLLSNILVEIPVAVLTMLSYLTFAYWMIGLFPAVGTYVTMLAALILTCFFAIAYGQLCASICFDKQLAILLQTLTISIQTMFSGFLLKHGSFPDIFRIFEDVSCIRYGYQILLISQWKNVQHLECEYNNYNISLNEPIDLNDDERIVCYQNGTQIIESFGYAPDSTGRCFGILTLLTISALILTYVALRINVKRVK